MLMTTALAVDFTTPGEYVKHVSFDEIRPGIVVAGDDALKNTPTFASGTTELTFWGLSLIHIFHYMTVKSMLAILFFILGLWLVFQDG